ILGEKVALRRNEQKLQEVCFLRKNKVKRSALVSKKWGEKRVDDWKRLRLFALHRGRPFNPPSSSPRIWFSLAFKRQLRESSLRSPHLLSGCWERCCQNHKKNKFLIKFKNM
ncbi:hypothetical protein CEXT_298041, partial [Caerostris extrusa]